MMYGYAGVSIDAQSLTAQVGHLTYAGARVFEGKVSGAQRDRAQLARAIKHLEPGNILTVTRLKRLARSTVDLLNILETVTEWGAGFKSAADAWADTTTSHSKLLVTMLGCMAESEQTLIQARTSEGRKRAKAASVHLLYKPKLDHFQRHEALAWKKAGEPNGSIARRYGVAPSTISRLRAVPPPSVNQ